MLCREVYHCDPATLDRQDFNRVELHLALLEVEGAVNSFTPLRR